MDLLEEKIRAYSSFERVEYQLEEQDGAVIYGMEYGLMSWERSTVYRIEYYSNGVVGWYALIDSFDTKPQGIALCEVECTPLFSKLKAGDKIEYLMSDRPMRDGLFPIAIVKNAQGPIWVSKGLREYRNLFIEPVVL